MKHNGKYINWLKKWIDGSLTAREEQQLDQAARDDDFLRDALEGLRHTPDADHELRLSRLRKKIKPQDRSAIIIPLALRRVAAAAILILGVGTIWWLNQPNTSREMSRNETESVAPNDTMPEELPAEPQEAIEESEADLEIEVPTEDRPETPPQRPTTPPAPPAPTPEIAATEQETNNDNIVMADEAIEEEIAEVAEPQRPIENYSTMGEEKIAQRSAREAVPPVPQAQEALPIQSLNGRILDEAGRPVAGAMVYDPSNQRQTISDAAGNFQIPTSPTSDEKRLFVQHFNYADTVFALKTNRPESLVLQQKLDNRIAGQAIQIAPDRQPRPVGGFEYFQVDSEAYQQFFSADQANRKQVELPQTTIVFTILTDGSIEQAEILETNNRLHAEKALQYLLAGPKWNLPAGMNSLRTQLTIPKD